MALLFAILVALIGLLPDATQTDISHPAPRGDGSQPSRNSFWRAGAFGSQMKEIPLTQGKTALVDDSDYDSLVQFTWHAIKQPRKHSILWYAVRSVHIKGTKSKCYNIQMHRQIMGLTNGELVDHKDRNGLNNQRENLRHSNHQQNSFNRAFFGNETGFKGVGKSRQPNTWKAYISRGGRRIHLGTFHSDIEAAKAYNEAARKHFGEFAYLNPV